MKIYRELPIRCNRCKFYNESEEQRDYSTTPTGETVAPCGSMGKIVRADANCYNFEEKG